MDWHVHNLRCLCPEQVPPDRNTLLKGTAVIAAPCWVSEKEGKQLFQRHRLPWLRDMPEGNNWATMQMVYFSPEPEYATASLPWHCCLLALAQNLGALWSLSLHSKSFHCSTGLAEKRLLYYALAGFSSSWFFNIILPGSCRLGEQIVDTQQISDRVAWPTPPGTVTVLHSTHTIGIPSCQGAGNEAIEPHVNLRTCLSAAFQEDMERVRKELFLSHSLWERVREINTGQTCSCTIFSLLNLISSPSASGH